MTALDEKGLRLAREVRAALRAREEDAELQAAIEVYDNAVTAEERQAAASYLLEHNTRADRIYNRRVTVAFIRMAAPELLSPEEHT